ncbi:MAG: Crp/Fnr family transcriptional regulator [Peptoniphilaceae bacterium]
MPNKNDLFLGLKEEEINLFLKKTKSKRISLEKEEAVFLQGEKPEYLFILEKGSVVVENVDSSGKKSIVNIFTEEGTVLGEVYLYIKRGFYDYSCYANEKSELLKIPKETLLISNKVDPIKKVILNNMLIILSQKAFYLNQKLIIFSSITLRQKLAKYILQNSESNNYFKLKLNREELAYYLSSSRPSVSRELMNMQRDNLIKIDKDIIEFDRKKLKEFL